MKLTDEERSDVMAEAIAWAEARNTGWMRDVKDAKASMLAVIEQFMTEAYEAGKRDAEADSRMYTGLGHREE